MGYSYRDSMFGPLATQLTVDLHAVSPVRPAAPSGLFGDDAAEAAFLAEVGGRGPDELGRMARSAALPPSHRIWE